MTGYELIIFYVLVITVSSYMLVTKIEKEN